MALQWVVLACLALQEISPGIEPRNNVLKLLEEAGPRCRAKVLRDYDLATRVQGIPLNGYDLADECSDENAVSPETPQGGRGIVICIMAHTACGANGLTRLVGKLSHNDIHIIIAFDKSAKRVEKNCLKTIKERYPQVLLHMTTDVEWGSWEMVQAEHLAMQTAVDEWADWTHFVLISGTDYPLQSPDLILDFFAKHKNKSFYYENTMQQSTRVPLFSELVSTCGMTLYHLGWRDTPPVHFFTVSNSWKFFERAFVADLVAGGNLNSTPLLQLLFLTLSVDEVYLQTLHKKSRFCHRMASIDPRDFYTFFWPGDSVERTCDPSGIKGTSHQWYCPKRPFYLTTKQDAERLAWSPSLFVRKVRGDASKKFLDCIDESCLEDVRAQQQGLEVGVRLRVKNQYLRMKEVDVADAGVPSFIQEDLEAVVTWEWVSGPHHSTIFTLANCTSPSRSMCTVQHGPLCLAYSSPTPSSLAFSSCRSSFAEPLLWDVSQRNILRSASKVSLVQYKAAHGLCAAKGGAGTPIVMLPCAEVGSGEAVVPVLVPV